MVANNVFIEKARFWRNPFDFISDSELLILELLTLQMFVISELIFHLHGAFFCARREFFSIILRIIIWLLLLFIGH